ncbi:MAG: low molecular weight phosphatase family protein [Niabella sp.]|nr:MAG: low molecular weight phosphatase family protein [Niabella sp.]
MNKILFVCYGNVGRSQIAEAYYNELSHDITAISAGVDPLTPSKYPKLVYPVIEVMAEDGIDVTNKKVKYITEEMVISAKEIIVMCDKGLCPKFLQNSDKVIYWDIPDPYNTSIGNFRIIRNQIKEKVVELIRT